MTGILTTPTSARKNWILGSSRYPISRWPPQSARAKNIKSTSTEPSQKLLRETWQARSLPFPVSLYVGVTFLSELPLADALQFVDARIAALETEIAEWKLSPLPADSASLIRMISPVARSWR